MSSTLGMGFALALCLCSASAFGQTQASRAIEAALDKDLKGKMGSTTLGMVEAYDKAAKAYAVEVGRVYRKLEGELPPHQREALIKGQLAWQEYLKSQRLMISYVYDADGTIHKPMAMALLKETLQHRLTELCAWFMRLQDDIDETVPSAEEWCKDRHGDLNGPDLLFAASQAAKPPVVKQKVP